MGKTSLNQSSFSLKLIVVTEDPGFPKCREKETFMISIPNKKFTIPPLRLRDIGEGEEIIQVFWKIV